MSSYTRQTDILATQPSWYTIPRQAIGRLNAEDFIYFRWGDNIRPEDYDVAIDTIDSNTPRKRISKLKHQVELPHVQLPWSHDGNVYVLPATSDKPAFHAPLSRTCMYVIPNTFGRNGYFQMEKFGMDRPPGL